LGVRIRRGMRTRVFGSGFGATRCPEKSRTRLPDPQTEGHRAHRRTPRTRMSFVHMIFPCAHGGHYGRASILDGRPWGVRCAAWAHKNVRCAHTTCTPRMRLETPHAESAPGSRAVSSRPSSPSLVRHRPPALTNSSLISAWGSPIPGRCPRGPPSPALPCPALHFTSLQFTSLHCAAPHCPPCSDTSFPPFPLPVAQLGQAPPSIPQSRLHDSGFQGEGWSESQRPQTEEAGGYVDAGRGGSGAREDGGGWESQLATL
jgi:hypothetical protein